LLNYVGGKGGGALERLAFGPIREFNLHQHIGRACGDEGRDGAGVEVERSEEAGSSEDRAGRDGHGRHIGSGIRAAVGQEVVVGRADGGDFLGG